MVMLKQQLSRQQISDFRKIELAMNYKSMFTYTNGEPAKLIKRQKIAQVVGVSETAVQRALFIMKYGSDEQKIRARIGGKGNTLSTIETEIKEGTAMPIKKIKPKKEVLEETERVCKECGRTLPIKSFAVNTGGYRNRTCNQCRSKKYGKYTNVKNQQLESVSLAMTEDELNDYLYNEDNEVNYTLDDMLEEIKINGENGIKSIETTLLIHKDVVVTEADRQKTIELLNTLSHKLNNLNQLIKE
jgi:hypothetical protein